MSDQISIPGITNKYNSQEAIQKIMETKKVKLKELEKEKESLIEKKKILNDIKEKVLSLQNSCRKLYGLDSPFEEKIGRSSNEQKFSINANRNAEIGEYKIKIIQKATTHKIASNSLPKNFKIPPGLYTIKVGDNIVNVQFDGGRIEDFVSQIKKNGENIINASFAYDTDKTIVIILESKNSGEKNKISFADEKTKNLFKSMGFFEEISPIEKKITLNNTTVKSQKPSSVPLINNGILLINPLEEYQISLPEKIKYSDTLVLDFNLKLEKYEKDQENPTGPNFTKRGELNLFNIYVEGEEPITNIPIKKFETQQIIEDNHFIDIITDKRKINIEEIDIVDNEQKNIKLRLDEILSKDENIKEIIVKNNNTNKKVLINEISIYDTKTISGINYKNEISTPQDAIIEFDGIKVRRINNTIDDIIKGITIQIYDKTEKEETIKVERNYEKIVESIGKMLKNYNELIELINKETFASSIEEERGKFSVDYGLITLGSKLRTIAMNSYQTKYGNELSLLSQIGISTNVSGTYQMNKEKLKGLLEINENLFVEMLNKYPDGVKELFGKDTNGDFIVDSGVAYEMYNLLRGYSITGQGFFDTRSKGLDEQIARSEKEIKDYQTQLEKEEKDLKQKFFKMEKAMEELEKNTKKIDNFNKQLK